VDGVFQGVVHTPQETYHVEHARKFFRRSADGSDQFNAVVYKYGQCNRNTFVFVFIFRFAIKANALPIHTRFICLSCCGNQLVLRARHYWFLLPINSPAASLTLHQQHFL
jgi:hypothetical protein